MQSSGEKIGNESLIQIHQRLLPAAAAAGCLCAKGGSQCRLLFALLEQFLGKMLGNVNHGQANGLDESVEAVKIRFQRELLLFRFFTGQCHDGPGSQKVENVSKVTSGKW